MISQSKLRMSVGLFYPIAILSCYILAVAEWGVRKELIADGISVSHFPFLIYFICGAFFILMGVFQWRKYRLWINPVLGILVGLLCFQGPYAISGSSFIFKGGYFITLIVVALFVIINWSTFYGQERYEINSRRLFKLAGERIFETANGFTDRPFSAGELQATREELLGFSRFLEGKYVTRIFHEGQAIYLAFSLNTSLLVISHPREVSHITISGTGSVSVFITESDYRQFRKTYNFNQLCESMGAVFKRFFEYYRQGLENRIITELKSAR